MYEPLIPSLLQIRLLVIQPGAAESPLEGTVHIPSLQ